MTILWVNSRSPERKSDQLWLYKPKHRGLEFIETVVPCVTYTQLAVSVMGRQQLVWATKKVFFFVVFFKINSEYIKKVHTALGLNLYDLFSQS